MPEFLVVALLLATLAMLFVLMPVMLNRSAPSGKRNTINVVLFKDRLQELENDRNQAVIGENEFQLLKPSWSVVCWMMRRQAVRRPLR